MNEDIYWSWIWYENIVQFGIFFNVWCMQTRFM